MEKIEQFSIIGIQVRTTNENGQSAQDIRALWARFMTEDIAAKIPNKTDSAVYSVYTDYEKDHTQPYTTLLGCKVSGLESIPGGMVGKTFAAATYFKHTAKGNILQGVIFNAWTTIWNLNLNRAFTVDFEVYGEKAQNPEDAEVDIFVAVQQPFYAQ